MRKITKFKCAECGKVTSGRLGKTGSVSGDGSHRYPRRHKVNGEDCPGNIKEAIWVDVKLKNPIWGIVERPLDIGTTICPGCRGRLHFKTIYGFRCLEDDMYQAECPSCKDMYTVKAEKRRR